MSSIQLSRLWLKNPLTSQILFFKRFHCHFLVFLAMQVFIEVYMKAFHKVKDVSLQA